ncbi:MAG: NAD(P)H-hydrate dehydratase, partial [Woeseia sp.]
STDNAVYSVADVRAIDRRTIDGGVGSFELMKRAAHFALDIALDEFPNAKHWIVLCGSGNNAGDGYMLANLASAIGKRVEVLHVTPPDALTGDARRAWDEAVKAGVTIAPFNHELNERAELIVDALLGSGLSRAIDGDYAAAVAAISLHSAPCLALDIPTGVHGDTGMKLGIAVQADVTATFVGRKAGLYFNDGLAHAGRVYFSDLGAPPEAFDSIVPLMEFITPTLTRAALPARARDAHKGDFGHVVIVAGGRGMPGAARLAAEAALRAGAGRVSVATHPENAAVVPASRPEIMCHGVNADGLAGLLANATVIALGPGLGQDEWARAMFSAVRKATVPMVFDADAINLLAAKPDKNHQRILTPHPGEAGRLLGGNAATVQRDRLAAVAALQKKFGGCVILKGHGTLVSRRNLPPLMCTAGNPGMATAGMGDVLTGIVAAMLAQGLPLETAAAVAVDVHASAADAAATFGERGMLATDVLEELRPWVNP